MRAILSVFAVGLLSACAPEIPDSGLAFDNSPDAQRARELALNGGAGAGVPIIPPPVISDESTVPATQAALSPVPTAVPTTVPTAAPAPLRPAQTGAAQPAAASVDELAAETAAALSATSANSGVPPVQADPSNPAPVVLDNPGISRENDFSAVSSERSIEGDAERIARNRGQYQIIQPTALPSRSGSGGPNIVTYALQTEHPRGTRLYSRSGFNQAKRAQRNCSKYPSADQAQIDFLSKGGPERDRMGLDPDGDGYACSWNPAPFRRAASN